MIPSLHVHDHLFVNKFIYGLKIPFTRTRLFGWRSPQRGEIVVFEYPYEGDPDSTGKDLIKRVMAVGGELVQVRDNRVYIDGAALPTRLLAERADCGEAVELLRACPDGGDDVCAYSQPDGGAVLGRYPGLAEAHAAVASAEGYACRQVRECGGELSWVAQTRAPLGPATARAHYYPVNDPSWPPERFDPLRFEPQARRYLPPENADFPAFRVPEGHLLVMGDNRDNSKDSRSSSIGFIPEDLIIGRAEFSYLPFDRFGRAPNESPSLSETDGRPVLTSQRLER
jgi:signal peptidase I